MNKKKVHRQLLQKISKVHIHQLMEIFLITRKHKKIKVNNPSKIKHTNI